jgi:AcrR family transcriptional regulator
MAERGWSTRAIASALGVGQATLINRYGAKIQEAKHHGAYKLLDILWQRAVTNKSDRVLTHLADRILGKVATKIELTDEALDSLIEERIKSSAEKEVE